MTSPFGCGVLVQPLGFFLNAGMERFSLDPDQANALAPGKRPLSPIAPVIVCREGKPVLAFGASRGERAVQILTQSLVNIIKHHLSIQEAVQAPLWHTNYSSALPEQLVVDPRFSPALIHALQEMGWQIRTGEEGENSPDCILMRDPKEDRLRMAIPSRMTGAVIAE
jgi:gamma-glutamyltranspeptidase/glutathione hydrolase